MRLFAAALLCVCAASGQNFLVGSRVSAIEVTEDGNPVSISLAKADATVLIFISTQCPISNSYNDRMNALYKEYAGKNVQFVFANANANESPDEIQQHAHANHFGFKVY